jgi:hypothetical protein
LSAKATELSIKLQEMAENIAVQGNILIMNENA